MERAVLALPSSERVGSTLASPAVLESVPDVSCPSTTSAASSVPMDKTVSRHVRASVESDIQTSCTAAVTTDVAMAHSGTCPPQLPTI